MRFLSSHRSYVTHRLTRKHHCFQAKLTTYIPNSLKVHLYDIHPITGKRRSYLARTRAFRATLRRARTHRALSSRDITDAMRQSRESGSESVRECPCAVVVHSHQSRFATAASSCDAIGRRNLLRTADECWPFSSAAPTDTILLSHDNSILDGLISEKSQLEGSKLETVTMSSPNECQLKGGHPPAGEYYRDLRGYDGSYHVRRFTTHVVRRIHTSRRTSCDVGARETVVLVHRSFSLESSRPSVWYIEGRSNWSGTCCW